MDMHSVAKILIGAGLLVLAAGLLLLLAPRIPFLGRLPGDIYIKKEHASFYFPLATSLLVSAVLSFIMWLWSRR